MDGRKVLEHVVRCTPHVERVDTDVIATSFEAPDDVIVEYAPRFGANVVRGSESVVFGRFELDILITKPPSSFASGPTAL